MKIETKLIHGGDPHPRFAGAVTVPIFQSATFEYSGQAKYEDLKYIRLNNTPNHVALGKLLSSLEGAEAAVVTASGMAAISSALLTVLKAGDHFLAQECLVRRHPHAHHRRSAHVWDRVRLHQRGRSG